MLNSKSLWIYILKELYEQVLKEEAKKLVAKTDNTYDDKALEFLDALIQQIIKGK